MEQHRPPTLWIVSCTVILAQVVAMWVLCSHQVRLAEARQSDHRVNAMALSDCLQYIPGATIATCQTRLADAVSRAD